LAGTFGGNEFWGELVEKRERLIFLVWAKQSLAPGKSLVYFHGHYLKFRNPIFHELPRI
jgi:hypothetical protein